MATVRTLRELEEHILAVGRVDGEVLRALRQVLHADGKIDRREADFLVELHKRVRTRTHAFEQFFYETPPLGYLSPGACAGAAGRSAARAGQGLNPSGTRSPGRPYLSRSTGDHLL
jgi:hypothetical protein